MKNNTALETEVENARHDVKTDSYPMSIGEITNLYVDGELEIHPDFQRVFRWSDEQKSKLIESIFLGIPLPSIFVSQRDDGVWDVIDGLQRLSTIFSFMGKLKNKNNKLIEPLILQKTKYLPSLDGIKWDNEDKEFELPNSLKLLFKRQKIDIKIIQRESDSDTKFELFQRLNTGGSRLTDQEIRNCLLIMVNLQAFNFVQELSNFTDFKDCIPLTERKEEESFYSELVMRFFVQRHINLFKEFQHSEIHPFLDDAIIKLFNLESSFNYKLEKQIFKYTFEVANLAIGEDAFKKYNPAKKKHEGAFSLSLFEVLTTWMSKKIEKIINLGESPDTIKLSIDFFNMNHNIIAQKAFTENTVHGIRALQRTLKLVDFAGQLEYEN